MNNQQIQDEFKNFINEKRFTELSKLIKKSKKKPADYLVRIGINLYLKEQRPLKVKLFFILKLLEITELNLDSKLLIDICKNMLELGTPYTLGYFSTITQIDDEIFKSIGGDIQKHYSVYIKEKMLVEITKLMEITKIEPLPALVSEGYMDYLKEGNIVSFVNLKKRTKLEAKREMLFEVFEFYKEKSKNTSEIEKSDYWKKRIEKLSKSVGIKFEDSN